MSRHGIFLTTTLSLLLGLPQGVLALDPARHLSDEALEECQRGRVAQDRAVRLAHFKRGEGLAEQAIEMDDRLAGSHFALFCNLGEQLRIDGEGLSSFFGFRRVMKELDRTLALDPNHLDALSSKGTLLMRLPGFLGGDAELGERMLRRVIHEDPKAVNARLTLAKKCAAQGEQEEAISFAVTALKIAQDDQLLDLLPEAKATLSELLPRPEPVLVAKQ